MQTIAGVPVLHTTEANKLSDERAFSFTTRADEIGVVYLNDAGKIVGIWCDFNPHEKKPLA
jgi:hypothetical protein